MYEPDDRITAMLFRRPRYIPVAVHFLPATWMKYRERLDELVARHPVIFGEAQGPRDYDAVGGTYVRGDHVDAWGCVWRNMRDGMEAIVTKHPTPTRDAVHTLRAPSIDTGFPHGFMYLRLCDLRGFEELRASCVSVFCRVIFCVDKPSGECQEVLQARQ